MTIFELELFTSIDEIGVGLYQQNFEADDGTELYILTFAFLIGRFSIIVEKNPADVQ